MLDIDIAIKHCLEVAEENDLAAGTYELLAENNHNAYERLTAETNSSRCAECAADHRQLAEWLTELRDRQWISVDERLPEEIGYYLVVIGNEMLISIDIAEYSEGYWHKHDKVLYWQPLPEPPKEGAVK